MDEAIDDKFDGYRNYNFNDGKENSLGKVYSDSIDERRNEEGNENEVKNELKHFSKL
jgi:hypothetical protein